ncbi:MAG: hypothetical protein M3463_19530, partial [Verrucomicrobiota bacterium]|nr:hypothetical protein [Verrucomicrobiota bacterium]
MNNLRSTPRQLITSTSLLLVAASFLLLVVASAAPAGASPDSPAAQARDLPEEIKRMLTAREDVWTEKAINQPDGPSYDYFAALLPPLRYVEAPFRVYPIPLSAPGAPVKARFIADGRGLNWLARQPNWRGEMGTPVTFRVGPDRATFGEDPRQLDGPKYTQGYLPIVQTRYRHADTVYAQECFADVHSSSAQHGVAVVKFAIAEGNRGRVEAQFESATPLKRDRGALRNEQGKVIACFDPRWEFNLSRNTLTAALEKGESALM